MSLPPYGQDCRKCYFLGLFKLISVLHDNSSIGASTHTAELSYQEVLTWCVYAKEVAYLNPHTQVVQKASSHRVAIGSELH